MQSNAIISSLKRLLEAGGFYTAIGIDISNPFQGNFSAEEATDLRSTKPNIFAWNQTCLDDAVSRLPQEALSQAFKDQTFLRVMCGHICTSAIGSDAQLMTIVRLSHSVNTFQLPSSSPRRTYDANPIEIVEHAILSASTLSAFTYARLISPLLEAHMHRGSPAVPFKMIAPDGHAAPTCVLTHAPDVAYAALHTECEILLSHFRRCVLFDHLSTAPPALAAAVRELLPRLLTLHVVTKPFAGGVNPDSPLATCVDDSRAFHLCDGVECIQRCVPRVLTSPWLPAPPEPFPSSPVRGAPFSPPSAPLSPPNRGGLYGAFETLEFGTESLSVVAVRHLASRCGLDTAAAEATVIAQLALAGERVETLRTHVVNAGFSTMLVRDALLRPVVVPSVAFGPLCDAACIRATELAAAVRQECLPRLACEKHALFIGCCLGEFDERLLPSWLPDPAGPPPPLVVLACLAPVMRRRQYFAAVQAALPPDSKYVLLACVFKASLALFVFALPSILPRISRVHTAACDTGFACARFDVDDTAFAFVFCAVPDDSAAAAAYARFNAECVGAEPSLGSVFWLGAHSLAAVTAPPLRRCSEVLPSSHASAPSAVRAASRGEFAAAGPGQARLSAPPPMGAPRMLCLANPVPIEASAAVCTSSTLAWTGAVSVFHVVPFTVVSAICRVRRTVGPTVLVAAVQHTLDQAAIEACMAVHGPIVHVRHLGRLSLFTYANYEVSLCDGLSLYHVYCFPCCCCGWLLSFRFHTSSSLVLHHHHI